MRLKLAVYSTLALACVVTLVARNIASTSNRAGQNSNARANTNAQANSNVRANSNTGTNTNTRPASNTNTATPANTNTAPPANTNTAPSANTNTAPSANTNTAPSANTNTSAPVSSTTGVPEGDGIDPPHAVDVNGKVIPNLSLLQPVALLILAKDSENRKENSGPLKADAGFDHVKHSTVASYSAAGKAVAACTECHHTDQPSAPPDLAFLKKFERAAALTTSQLESSRQPVKSCRACHFQISFEGGESPASVTYPESMQRPPSGKLDNEIAYHLNCIKCHETANKRTPPTKAPTACESCHEP